MKFRELGVAYRSLNPFSLITTLALLNTVLAGPYPKDDLHDTGFSYLQDRSCVSYCGAQNQYCCAAGEACYTNQANIAYCSEAAGNLWGGYAVYTTTYTETNLILRTSTYTSSWGVATSTWQPAPDITQAPICTSSLGESSCGNICCASDQRCAFANSCTAHTASSDESTTYTTFSAPFRPTSGDISTKSATTTVPFQPPATASGSIFPTLPLEDNHKLSGGAIAGIVIGSIAGVALLLLCCSCCILKSKKSGKDKKYHDSNIGGSSIPEKSSTKTKLLVGGGILAATLVFLGLKRRERAASVMNSPRNSSSNLESPISDSASRSSDESDSYVGRSNEGSVSRTRDLTYRE
ncbi:hypothetical protein EV44_g0110 [Erysiphe necator]|uniref:Uncharacterized protein n=1 Tax=Uncinula necator TaxID=52586 RepID=A0A0B1PHW5_UNCNE|nr:hypothetical protein EV44_g0110 [Erysiphe necator]